MSGIVGVHRRDGQPIEEPLLQRMTEFLSYRGPDGTGVWCGGSAGLGHTLLCTNRESLGDRQPRTLDGRFSVVADARIDSRAELQAGIEAAGGTCDRHAPDSELILRAYVAWEEECVQHLRGDFAFAVWDAQKRSLFCARDHFGIKPFYYANSGQEFVFSNTLNCIRIHPRISGELNDAAIADFLLFGLNYDPATTSFRDIRRLPPAHALTITENEITIRRYWAPATDARIRYAHRREYVDHFQNIFREAVSDRLHTDRAAILLSGGLDSGAVAATAKSLSKVGNKATNLRAYTITYERLFSDRERIHAESTAAFLNIPIQYVELDAPAFLPVAENPEFATPEPTENPFGAIAFEHLRAMAADSRVALSGEGSDNLMDFQMWPYVKHLAMNLEWMRLAAEGLHFLWIRPFPWRGIRAKTRGILGGRSATAAFPAWIAPELQTRFDLRRRWIEGNSLPDTPRHEVRPRAHASLGLRQWTSMFESDDPGVTRLPLEIRYPFLDLRVVDYLLALPPFPLLFKKALLRDAMKGALPETELRRPKTPLPGDPLSAVLNKTGLNFLDSVRWDGRIGAYLDLASIPLLRKQLLKGASAESRLMAIRPLCLNLWLQSVEGVRYK